MTNDIWKIGQESTCKTWEMYLNLCKFISVKKEAPKRHFYNAFGGYEIKNQLRKCDCLQTSCVAKGLCFVHFIFRFWFFVTFGNQVTKIWKYYKIFVFVGNVPGGLGLCLTLISSSTAYLIFEYFILYQGTWLLFPDLMSIILGSREYFFFL